MPPPCHPSAVRAAGAALRLDNAFPPVAVSQLLRGRSCLRLLVEHIRLTHAKLKDHRTTSIEPHRNMVQNYFATHLAPVWQALRDETQTALLAGLAGGIAILVILTLFPGDPFDYGAGDDGNAEGLKKYRAAYERARQRGEKPPPMPTPTELKKPEAKKEKDPPLVIDLNFALLQLEHGHGVPQNLALQTLPVARDHRALQLVHPIVVRSGGHRGLR